MKVSVYFEEHPETFNLVPMKMVVYFGPGKIAWDKNYFYLALTSPFKRHRMEDFDNDIMSITITQGELIRNPDKEAQIGPCFGVYLPYLINRLEKDIDRRIQELEDRGVFVDRSETPDDHYIRAEQFIIQMADIEEIMQLEDIDRYYRWK
jgi:hypothetical protein